MSVKLIWDFDTEFGLQIKRKEDLSRWRF